MSSPAGLGSFFLFSPSWNLGTEGTHRWGKLSRKPMEAIIVLAHSARGWGCPDVCFPLGPDRILEVKDPLPTCLDPPGETMGEAVLDSSGTTDAGG